MNPTLASRMTAWRSEAHPSPIMSHAVCSDGADDTDDNCMVGRAVYFIALTLAGQIASTELTDKVARLHRHGHELHIVVREPVSPELAYYLSKGFETATGGERKTSDVRLHLPGSGSFAKIWQERRFAASDIDPMGRRQRAVR